MEMTSFALKKFFWWEGQIGVPRVPDWNCVLSNTNIEKSSAVTNMIQALVSLGSIVAALSCLVSSGEERGLLFRTAANLRSGIFSSPRLNTGKEGMIAG